MRRRSSGMQSTRRSVPPLVVLALLLARGAAGCGDDPADPAPLAEEGGAAGDARGPTGEEREGGAAVDAPSGPPTFCTGIVFLASFDQGVTAEVGAGPTRPDGGVAFAPGRYGNALSLVAAADAAPAVFYDRGDGGMPVVYPENEGTLAYWYRQTAPITSSLACHVRPQTSAGLVIARERTSFGLWSDLGGTAVLTFEAAELAPFLRATGFDHIAVAWRRVNPDAGTPSLARFAVNGGIGEVLADGGFDAAAYADASPDEAGNLHIPYRAQVTNPPIAPGRLQSLRIGGVIGTAPQGSFDDFAVWSRVLSFEEIAELYRSAGAIRATCKL